MSYWRKEEVLSQEESTTDRNERERARSAKLELLVGYRCDSEEQRRAEAFAG